MFKAKKWSLGSTKTWFNGDKNPLFQCTWYNETNAYSFINTRTVQEVVYNILLEVWLRKCLPGILFINTNLPEIMFRWLSQKKNFKYCQMAALVPLKRYNWIKIKILDKDMIHGSPKTRKVCMFKNACLVQFASNYYKKDTMWKWLQVIDSSRRDRK